MCINVKKTSNMERMLVFAMLIVGFNVLVDAKSDEAACMNLMMKMKDMCCETMDVMKHEDDDKCEKKDADKWTCEDSKCVLEKRNLMDRDEVNESKFKDLMKLWQDKDSDVEPMRKRVEEACLDGKYKEYPPEDVCDATRFHMCVGLNSIVECQKWKDDDACKEMPEDAKQCKNLLESKD